ncbi:hypothetical protein Q3G72_029222 [Acer saccharum]|nr:hypothetical protein Q3G72_029222 [Acer saccharum]
MQTAENERATASLSREATASLSGGEQVAGQMENMGYEQFLKVKRNKWNKEALINVGCRLKNIATIENIIRKEGKHKEFMSSCFKQFTNFPQNSLFSAMIVHGVLLRKITIDDATENDLFISLGGLNLTPVSTKVLNSMMDDTYQLTISAKFLGTQVEFGIENTHMYTLTSLWADVYLFSCSTMPEPSESFKVEARLPWSGEYRHIKDDRDLQYLFNHFREKKIDTVRIDVVLISLVTSVLLPNRIGPINRPPRPITRTLLATMPQLAQCPQELGNVLSSSESYAGNPPPLQASTEIVEILNDSNAEFVDQPIPEDSEDEDYMPYTSKIAKSIDISDNSCHDNATFVNEGNGNATPGSSDNSDDDHPSNAASFDYDLNNMVDSSSDEEEGNNIPHINRRDKSYKVVEGGPSLGLMDAI